METCFNVYMSTQRPTSPRPPTFPTGSLVTFRHDGRDITGTFVERFTPSKGAGIHYRIKVDGRIETIFANGPTGRTVRKA